MNYVFGPVPSRWLGQSVGIDNRPHPEITFERQVQGLVAFSAEYKGKLWPEVMLVRGLNDTEE